ncbi:MAG: hypothetical protein P4L35_12275 [Ignavibacteriaceae bacterium]|nr:hypothetical protein [Ignavibacteriaceae bacterium]
MSKEILFTYINNKIFFLSTVILLSIFSYSPEYFAQDEGVSFQGDFLSAVVIKGFDQTNVYPGNFLIGGQYNYPLFSNLEINGGFDFMWLELNGKLDGISKQAEVFMPFVFGGLALNFNEWKIFGKMGVSLDRSMNIVSSNKGWINSILNFYMGAFQFGIKCPLDKSLSVSASVGTYFGPKIKIENTYISFSTINLGLSYNLFSTEVEPQKVEKGVDEYRDRYFILQQENTKLNKQLMDLHDTIKTLETRTVVKVDSIPTVHPVFIPSQSLSIDSVNKVYNLHLREALNLSDFVNKKGLKEEGKLILDEYNNIAATFKGFQSGIYLTCTVGDAKAFKKHEAEFSRIKFRNNPSGKNKLVIDIDVKATEAGNKIKLEIK